MHQVGPPLWKSIHYLAFAYPENPTKDDEYWSRMYVESISHLLPCPDCRMHFQRMLGGEYPLRNGSRNEFSSWSVGAHNRVNSRLGKRLIPYGEACDMYDMHRGQCDDPPEDLDVQCKKKKGVSPLVLFTFIIGTALLVLATYVLTRRRCPQFVASGTTNQLL